MDDAIATRYAGVILEAAKAARQVEETQAQLVLLKTLLETHPELQQLLRNPDVEPHDKVAVLERVLQGTATPVVRSALNVVMSFGRAERLADIITAFQAAVDQDQGRLRVTVRSARPLPEATLNRLRTGLEHREHKQIELMTELDPALIGGLQVVLGHRVIDGSVQTALTELKQRLQRVRVH